MGSLRDMLRVIRKLHLYAEPEGEQEKLERMVEDGRKVAEMMRHPGYEVWRARIEETLELDKQRLMSMPQTEFITKGANDVRPKILAFQSAAAVVTDIVLAGVAAEDRLRAMKKRPLQQTPPVA